MWRDMEANRDSVKLHVPFLLTYFLFFFWRGDTSNLIGGLLERPVGSELSFRDKLWWRGEG